ncbi:MAG: hypothetical protein QOI48_899 [Solirubrobacteraceae bacterium]|nr:hypothetical protein [Solirubrobacteraceae bacterium]
MRRLIGDHGYVSAFGNNTDSSYKFTSMCIDSGTGKIVLVGQQTTPAVRWGVVERLLQPASGSDTASLDTSFNASATKTGTFTVPSDCGSMQGYTFNSGGRIVVSGDSSANAEMLTEICGSSELGYSTPR